MSFHLWKRRFDLSIVIKVYILTILILITMVRINIKLREELHKALRIKAVKEGIVMADAVVKAIENYVEGDDNGL